MKKSNLKTSVLRVVQKVIGSEVERNNSGNVNGVQANYNYDPVD